MIIHNRSIRRLFRCGGVLTVLVASVLPLLPSLGGTVYPWRPLPSASATSWVVSPDSALNAADIAQQSALTVSFDTLLSGLRESTFYRTLSDRGVPDDYLRALYLACTKGEAASSIPLDWLNVRVCKSL